MLFRLDIWDFYQLVDCDYNWLQEAEYDLTMFNYDGLPYMFYVGF